MTLQKIQFILANGQPQWAVVPIEDYSRLLSAEQTLHQLLSQRTPDPTAILPPPLQERLKEGESPIRIWREYKQLSQHALAQLAGISIPYLSQLEHRIRQGSKRVLKSIAIALGVDCNAIIG